MTDKALRLTALALLVAAMGSAGTPKILAEDFAIDSFTDATMLPCWYVYWGPLQFSWDGTQDHTGGASGALSMAATFTNDPAAQNSFGLAKPFCCTCDPYALPTMDASAYLQISAWIRWDTNSSIGIDQYNSDGDAGLVAGFVGPNWNMNFLPPVAIPNSASNGWARMTWPLPPGTPGIYEVAGLVIRKWDTQTLAGSVRFWLDDIVLVHGYCCAPPPPTMTIQKASPGLNLFTGPTNQYERESIRTAPGSGTFSWLGSGTNPVSYAFTVTNVDCLTTNFQIHMFLITNPGGESAPDWDESCVIRADLLNVGPEKHGQWSFSYKTNKPGLGISQYTCIGSISDVSMLGTWKLTFRNDTDVTLTTPGGATTNFTLPHEVAGSFPEPLLAYFGVQANDIANMGCPAVLSSVEIEGSTVSAIHENFSGPLDPNVWEVVAGYPPGIQVVAPGSLSVKWTLPDTGLVLQTSPGLGNQATWSTNGLPTPFNLRSQRQVLVPPSPGPGSDQSRFFRLSRPAP